MPDGAAAPPPTILPGRMVQTNVPETPPPPNVLIGLTPSVKAIEKWGPDAAAQINGFVAKYVRLADHDEPPDAKRVPAEGKEGGQPEYAKRTNRDCKTKLQPESADDSQPSAHGDDLSLLSPLSPCELQAGDCKGVLSEVPRRTERDRADGIAADVDDKGEVRRWESEESSRYYWQHRGGDGDGVWEDVHPDLHARLEEADPNATFVYTGQLHGCRGDLEVDLSMMQYTDNGHGGLIMRLQRIQQTVIWDETTMERFPNFSITTRLKELTKEDAGVHPSAHEFLCRKLLRWQRQGDKKEWQYMPAYSNRQLTDHILKMEDHGSDWNVVKVQHHYQNKRRNWQHTLYTMDLEIMKQTNTDSCKKRRIRLVADEDSLAGVVEVMHFPRDSVAAKILLSAAAKPE